MKEGDKPEGIRDTCQVRTCFKQKSAKKTGQDKPEGIWDICCQTRRCFEKNPGVLFPKVSPQRTTLDRNGDM